MAVLIVLVVVGFLFCLLITRWKNSEFAAKVSKIPGPPGLPFVGNAIEIARKLDDIVQLFQVDWVNKYGRVYRISIGSHVFIHTSSPDCIEEILKSSTLIEKSSSYDILRDWLGEGLLISTGDKWRYHRRLLTSAFHFQILDNFLAVFNEQSRVLIKQCEKYLALDANNQIDIYPLITRCTLDIICETVMGVPVKAQTADSDYVKAVNKISQILMQRIVRPWLLVDKIFYLTQMGREFKSCLETVHQFTRRVVSERKNLVTKNRGEHEQIKEGKGSRKAFLDLLLETAENGATLTDDDIQDEVDTFMFEGHDTNAAALTWFLYLIASHPLHQTIVYEELVEVFGNSDRPCTSEDIPRLKYLDCCIKETMRLFPSVPGFERKITEEIQLGGYTIPVGCTVAVHTYAAHRHPDYIPNPDQFDPNRFRPENSAGRHPFAFIPFSAGPRNCIGQKFAVLEQKVILSTLLRKFRFEVTPQTVVKPRQQVVLKPEGGVLLRLNPR